MESKSEVDQNTANSSTAGYQAAEAGLEPLREELAQLAREAGWTTEADVFTEVS